MAKRPVPVIALIVLFIFCACKEPVKVSLDAAVDHDQQAAEEDITDQTEEPFDVDDDPEESDDKAISESFLVEKDVAAPDGDIVEKPDVDSKVASCSPNPCTKPHQTVCREVSIGYGEYEHYCACDEGWIGLSCEKCQRGHWGPDCAPCACGKEERCNDGSEGNGACSCARPTLPDGSCPCPPGWSGEECDIFGENWECLPEGASCGAGVHCCVGYRCIASFTADGSLCRKEFRYGGEEIRRLAVSPDGSLVATARMGAARLHRADTLEELFTLSKERNSASTAAAFSPDGSLLVISENGVLMLYDMEDGSFSMPVSLSYNQSLVFSSDGTMLAASHQDGFTIFTVADGTITEYYSDALPYIDSAWNADSVSFSPDGAILAVGSGLNSYSSTVYLYDVTNKTELLHLPVKEYYTEVSFSPGGTMLATGGYATGGNPGFPDPPVNIFRKEGDAWSLKKNLDLMNDDEIHALDFNYSDDFLAVAGRHYSNVYRVYDDLYPLLFYGWDARFSDNGRDLLVGREDGALDRYTVPLFDRAATTGTLGGASNQLSKDGTRVIIFHDYPGSVAFTEPLTGAVEREVVLPAEGDIWYRSYAFGISPDTRYGIFSFNYSEAVGGGYLLANLTTGKRVARKENVDPSAVAFSPDNAVVAIHAMDGSVRKTFLHALPHGDAIDAIAHTGETAAAYQMGFSPDGMRLAVVFSDHTVVYDRTEWLEAFRVPHRGSLSFSPDSAEMFLADNTVYRVSLSDGTTVPDPDINSRVVVFSADGRYLITDKEIRDIAGERSLTLPPHYYGITNAAIAPDNSVLLTGGKDTVKLLDTKAILEPYAGDCRTDGDCGTGAFCNVQFYRCFQRP